MKKTKKRLQGKFGLALLSVLVFALLAPAVQADEGVVPSVGFETTLSTNGSVIFNMANHAALRLQLVSKTTPKMSSVVMYGTKGTDNAALHSIRNFYTRRKSSLSTGTFWQRNQDCVNNICPKIRFVCDQGSMTIKVLGVTPVN